MPTYFTTNLPAPSNLTNDRQSGDIDVFWDDNTNNEDGFKLYYREKGTSSWNLWSDLKSDTTTDKITNVDTSKDYEVYVAVYTEHVTSDSSVLTIEKVSDILREVNSHIDTIVTSTSRTISLPRTQTSHTDKVVSGTVREFSMVRTPTSYTSTVYGESSRKNVVDRENNSNVRPIISWEYNDRVALDLLNYELTFDTTEAAYYTPWFQETRVIGDEDTLILQALTVDGAKEPSADVTVQYSDNGGSSITRESEKVTVSHDEEIYELDLPVDDEGHYRIRVGQYSGHNSIHSIRFGAVH